MLTLNFKLRWLFNKLVSPFRVHPDPLVLLVCLGLPVNLVSKENLASKENPVLMVILVLLVFPVLKVASESVAEPVKMVSAVLPVHPDQKVCLDLTDFPVCLERKDIVVLPDLKVFVDLKENRESAEKLVNLVPSVSLENLVPLALRAHAVNKVSKVHLVLEVLMVLLDLRVILDLRVKLDLPDKRVVLDQWANLVLKVLWVLPVRRVRTVNLVSPECRAQTEFLVIPVKKVDLATRV
jgi:hypothetical protein